MWMLQRGKRQTRPNLSWNENREQFLSVFLHETAHPSYQAAVLKFSDSNVLPPILSTSLRGAILGVNDSLDELRVESQALEWFQFSLIHVGCRLD